jgi:cytidylate kinase
LKVITVSKAYGAGGSRIAKALAERTGYRYVDEEFLGKTEKDPAQCSPLLCSIEDEVAPGFLDKVAGLMSNRSFYKTALALCVYDLALRNDLVLVGAGGHFVLAGCPSLVSIQVVDKLSDRVRNVAHERKLRIEDAIKLVETKDKKKVEFIKYYFDEELFDPLMFHLTINTGFVAQEAATEVASMYCARFFAGVDAAPAEQFLRDRLVEKKAEMVLFHIGITHGAKVDFKADRDTLAAHGIVGGEHEKGQLLEALKKMSEVKTVVDDIKVEVLSGLIY